MRLVWGNYDPKTNSFAKTELVSLLVSEGAETRAEAMRRLEIAGEDDLIAFLTDCITHYSPELRSAAARVLTSMGDDSVLFHFMEQLKDRDFHAMYEAKKAILAFEDSRPLIRYMQRYLDLGWDAGLAARIDSIEALGKLGDERAIPCLIVALYEGNDSARTAAVDALSRLGSERAESALTALLNRSKSERVMAAARRAIRRIRGDKPLVSLKEQLRVVNERGKRLSALGWKTCAAIAEAMGTMVHDLDNGKTKYSAYRVGENPRCSREVGRRRRGAGWWLPRTSMSAMSRVLAVCGESQYACQIRSDGGVKQCRRNKHTEKTFHSPSSSNTRFSK